MAKRKEGFGENRCVRSMEIQIRGQRGSRGEFPGGPGIRTLCSHCQGCGFNPWSGTYNPSSHEVRQEKKKKRGKLESQAEPQLYLFLVVLSGLWDLGYPAGEPVSPAEEAWDPNYWTAREL